MTINIKKGNRKLNAVKPTDNINKNYDFSREELRTKGGPSFTHTTKSWIQQCPFELIEENPLERNL